MFQIQNSADSLNLEKPQVSRNLFQPEFGQIAFQPPAPPPQANECFRHIFFAENDNNFEAAILTLEMDFLTMTIVENYS